MSTALKLMTVEEFLPWAEGKEGRWELHDGVPVMMSPERSVHAETKAEAYVALREAIRLKGLPCRSLSGWHGGSDRRAGDIRTGRIGCLRPSRSPDAIEIDNPVIVVEVLSPSTAAIDHGRKLSGYFSLPERAALSDPRSRSARRHSPQAWLWRRDRDPGVDRRRRAA